MWHFLQMRLLYIHFQTMTMAMGCVQNKFNILAKEEQESNAKNELDDPTGNPHFTSSGPRVCIIRFKKFTMSGRTKEGLDNDRNKKKKTGNEKEVKHPSKRIHCSSGRRTFAKKGSKKNRKQSKSHRTIRKKYFQTSRFKVRCHVCIVNFNFHRGFSISFPFGPLSSQMVHE